MKIYTRVNKLSPRGFGNIYVLGKGTKYERRQGTFKSAYGIVEIYDEPMFTSFNFIFNGVDYYKSISSKKKQFTNLGLVRIAGKFMREVVEKRSQCHK